ncbi:MAG: Rha family transcriptional regulator [Porphyromonas sp.]|nr:Rha family transcriptional regulator [Porphyromonas sp.]
MGNLVEIKNNQVVVSSRRIAEHFGKRHADVLEGIDNIKTENSVVTSMFLETSYKAGTGKAYKEYLMNRDGFSLLVMGFTGKKALEWKIKYIQAFNKMEAALKSGAVQQPIKISCKYFRGEPILTVGDLAVITGVTRGYLFYVLKQHMIPYRVLAEKELVAYKRENKLSMCTISRLVILAKASALELLRKMHQDTKKNLEIIAECFPEDLPKKLENLVTDAPYNAEAKQKARILQKKITTLEVLLDNYMRCNSAEISEGLGVSMMRVGTEVFSSVCAVRDTKLNLIPQP